MKILPLLNHNIYTNLSANLRQKEIYPVLTQMKSDTFELSFKGEPSYIEQAKENSGIHCPICGKAMLNENDLAKIIERASNVVTVDDFTKILREYKDYVPESMHDILKRSGEDCDNSNINFHDYFANLSKNAFFQHKRHIEKSNNYLIEYSKTQTEDKQKELLEILQTVKPTDSHVTYKNKVLPLIKTFNTASKQEYMDILNNTILSLKDSSNYYFVFKIPDYRKKTPGEIAEIMATRIFSKSIMEHSKISRTWDTENPNNEILTCQSCSTGDYGKTFISPTDLTRPDLKENIRKYLQDISMTMGQRNHSTNAPYIIYLSKFMDKISQHRITFSIDEVNTIKKLNHIASRHSEFTPISQTKTDVPCAGCGSTMLPHDIKKEIENELKNRSTIKGYIGVLKKYYKYIGEYARPGAEIILKLAENSTGMSKTEFVKNVQTQMNKVSEDEINGIMFEFEKLRPAVHRNNTKEEAENYDKIVEILQNIIDTPKFKNDFNYKDLMTELKETADLWQNTPVGIYTLLNKIRIACYKNSLVKINEFDKERDKDSIQTILFKLFSSDLGTTDHLVAMNKGGEKGIENMIGLCKACNGAVKVDKKVYSWLVQNKNVAENFLKQLMVIDAMARRGELEGFDDWAKTIADKMYTLTYNRYDIRKFFDDPK